MRLCFHQTGKPTDVLKLEPGEARALLENEVAVRMEYAPVHPADLNYIEGVYGRKPSFPAVPGNEGCGKIVEIGEKVVDLAVGDRVIPRSPAGCWTQMLIGPEGDFFKVPGSIDPVQAAMMRINPATAWHLLHHFRELQPGDVIAQNAANSAVGRAVIQIAKQNGVRTINFARRADVFDDLQSLGADVCLVDDEEGLESACTRPGNDAPMLAFNAVGGESATRLMKLLAPGGTLVTYGAMSRHGVKIPNSHLIFKDLTLRGAWITRWMETASREESTQMLRELSRLISGDKLALPVDAIFDMCDWPAAIARAQQDGRPGKVLLRLK